VSCVRAIVLIGLVLCACEAKPPATPGPGPTAARSSKQALFASASLVPTREGERARRELAIAGQLELALEHLEIERAHVDVELRDPAAVIVVARLPSGRSEAEVKAEIAELSQVLIPGLEPSDLHVWLRAAVAEDPAPAPSERRRSGPRLWAIVLLSIGLGLSLGIIVERVRMRGH